MEKNFWMVWVAGHGAPKHMHTSFDDAKSEAERLRRDKTTREVYVLQTVFKVDGRKLITLKKSPSSAVVEAK